MHPDRFNVKQCETLPFQKRKISLQTDFWDLFLLFLLSPWFENPNFASHFCGWRIRVPSFSPGCCLVGSSILLRSSFIFFGWFPLQASLIAQQFLGLTERTSRQLAWSSKLCAHPFDIYLSIYKIHLQIIPLSWLHIPNSLLLWKSLKFQVWSVDWIHTSAIPRTTEAAIIIYVWWKIGGANPQTELFWWDGSFWILDGSSKLWCFEWNGIL